MNQPPYNPYAPPPPQGYGYAAYGSAPRAEDAQHLDALAVYHYVYAAFIGLAGLAVGVYVAIGLAVAASVATHRSGAPAAAAIGGIVVILGGIVALVLLAKAAMVVYSGMSLRRRRHRTFSFVLA